MRYSLRNKEKIKAAFGENSLKEITESLDAFFSTGAYIESYLKKEGERQLLTIINLYKSTFEISFYVISKKFDVYNLALKGYGK